VSVADRVAVRAFLHRLQATQQTFVRRFVSAEQNLDLFRSNSDPTVRAFDALDEPGQRALASDPREAVELYARPAGGALLIPAEYLEVAAVRLGNTRSVLASRSRP
jgi:hypothetical protein